MGVPARRGFGMRHATSEVFAQNRFCARMAPEQQRAPRISAFRPRNHLHIYSSSCSISNTTCALLRCGLPRSIPLFQRFLWDALVARN